ncbi:rhodanese-like domain-containing protein [Candidatus Saccharibacteria bacterium]|nr:rhodanese-like domain-containing protein [Candidatus Saccharibacteria bacterium]
MKKFIIITVVIIAGLAGLLLIAPHDDEANQTPQRTFSSVQADVKNGAVLYDVRTPEEYASGHFASAANFSLQQMQAGQLPSVSKDTKIYVYCHSGNRSSQATAILQNAGYTNVVDLGGLSSVESIGGTLTKS